MSDITNRINEQFVNTLLSRLSHDLINPIGGVDMLLSQSADADAMEIIKESIGEAIQLLDIIRNIFNPNLTLNHVEKMAEKIGLVSMDIRNLSNNTNLPKILLLTILIAMQKKQNITIIIAESDTKITIPINQEELSDCKCTNYHRTHVIFI